MVILSDCCPVPTEFKAKLLQNVACRGEIGVLLADELQSEAWQAVADLPKSFPFSKYPHVGAGYLGKYQDSQPSWIWLQENIADEFPNGNHWLNAVLTQSRCDFDVLISLYGSIYEDDNVGKIRKIYGELCTLIRPKKSNPVVSFLIDVESPYDVLIMYHKEAPKVRILKLVVCKIYDGESLVVFRKRS